MYPQNHCSKIVIAISDLSSTGLAIYRLSPKSIRVYRVVNNAYLFIDCIVLYKDRAECIIQQ